VLTVGAQGIMRCWPVSRDKKGRINGGGSGGVNLTPAERAEELKTAGHVWDSRTGRLLFGLDQALARKGAPADSRIERMHSATPPIASFSPDGRWIVTGGDSHPFIWEASTGRPVGPVERPVKTGFGSIEDVFFSPDSARLALVCRNLGPNRDHHRLYVVDRESRKVRLTLEVHPARPQYAVFSPDGRQLALALADGTAQVLDCSTPQEFDAARNRWYGVEQADLSHDGRYLATRARFQRRGGNDFDMPVRVWDLARGRVCGQIDVPDHYLNLHGFNPAGPRLLVDVQQPQTNRGRFEVRGSDGRLLATLADPNQRVVNARGWWSADGKEVRAVNPGGVFRTWDASGKLLWQARLDAVAGGAYDVSPCPDGRHLLLRPSRLTLGYQKPVKLGELWDVRRQARTAELSYAMQYLGVMSGQLAQLDWSADGKRLATIGNDQAVRIFEMPAGKIVLTVPPGNGQVVPAGQIGPVPKDPEQVIAFRFGPDGRRLVTFSTRFNDAPLYAMPEKENLIPVRGRIHDAHSGELVAELSGLRGKVRSAAFSNDGRLLLVVASDGVAHLYDADTGREHVTYHTTRRIEKASFSADGRWVLTVSERPPFVTDPGTGQRVFTPEDDEVRLWPVDVVAEAKRWLVRDFTPQERERFEIAVPQ
jgi:WD40 repeat protein